MISSTSLSVARVSSAVGFSLLCAAVAQAELRGLLLREVHNPFGDGSLVGSALAHDGTFLYAGSGSDGTIRVIEPTSLAVVRTIPTPASTISGLDFVSGELFAVEPVIGADPTFEQPSRIHVIDIQSGSRVRFFDAPENRVHELSRGPDDLLWAMDGFDGRGADNSKVYLFNRFSGTLTDTLRGQGPPSGLNILNSNYFTQWLSDGSLLIDDGRGSSRISFYEREDKVLVRAGDFPIDGLTRLLQPYGVAATDSHLYLMALGSGTPDRLLLELQLVPEPPTFVLALGIGAVAIIGRRLYTRRGAALRVLMVGNSEGEFRADERCSSR